MDSSAVGCTGVCEIQSECFQTKRSDRYAEFGHAVLERMLERPVKRPPVYYIGVFREEQRDCQAALEKKVYDSWDSSDQAPPKRRPTESLPEPSLELLSWCNNAPGFPASPLQKFAEGTKSHADVLAMEKELIQELPDADRQTSRGAGQASSTSGARATGRPDYSIDGGAQLLEITRLLDKEHVAESGFNVTRPAGKFQII